MGQTHAVSSSACREAEGTTEIQRTQRKIPNKHFIVFVAAPFLDGCALSCLHSHPLIDVGWSRSLRKLRSPVRAVRCCEGRRTWRRAVRCHCPPNKSGHL